MKMVSLNCGCLVWCHISIHLVSIIYVGVFVCLRSVRSGTLLTHLDDDVTVCRLMAWIEQQQGSISYLPWTWNTWGVQQKDTAAREVQRDEAEVRDVRARGGGEALVSDYDHGTPTAWGTAVRSSFAKASVGVPNAAEAKHE